MPVGDISQEAAARYAREHRQGRLPTVLEFERAVLVYSRAARPT